MTSSSNPSLVTVLVDTYNHEQFIDEALRSVIDQEFDMNRVEIIVVDDGSTDGTPQKLAAYGDRIRVIRKSNGGQGSAFNLGIAEARGTYIAMLDGDDWWHPRKLGRIVTVLDENPETGFVGHGMMITDGKGKDQILAPSSPVEFRLDSADNARRFVAHRAFMGTSRMAGRTEIFRRLLPVPDDLIVEADEFFFTLAPAICKAVILPDTLCYYRLHGANLYQFSGHDPRRLKLKSRVHTCLAKTIPPMLEKLGVPSAAQSVVLDHVLTEARRLHLAAFGGFPGSALPTEWHILRHQWGAGSISSWSIKCLMLALAAILPASWFYRLRARWGSLRPSADSCAV